MSDIKRYFYNFNKYKHLLFELVLRDIKLKYRKSVLGIVWSLLNPLFMMIIMTIVFSKLFNRVENYTVYFLTGKVLFDFFSQSTKDAMNSVVKNSSLIKKIYVPKYIFPLSKIIASFVNLGFSLIAVMIMLIVSNVKLTYNIIFFPIPLIFLFFISLGIGLMLSAITVFFRDIIHLYSVFCLGLMYLTPIFYPADIIPSKFMILQKINPLYHIVSYFREIVLYGRMPDLRMNLTCGAFAIFSMLIGLLVFRKKQDHFIMHI